ncbi:hypothetical protein HG535_0A05620 [Zygotorulaspora mrakii]|uniref:AAA+ ATPase domain-containing protein n=1 Tax=Zygotorulaspora mrakii TaxID=42260 RepID=A0A7H9AWH7_ZYGMR|nr:uncharacterized protein HG535_0A05620 [Zygotorulaspora mrakii]QLG70621.1 hypothetical protein HG535_0A05620 [Zygotorulaspora mrakii]
MPNDTFNIPANFTLIQSLQLLYSIVTNHCDNFKKQKNEHATNSHNLKKMFKRFDSLLYYMNDGLEKIEKHYQNEDGLNKLVGSRPELRSQLEDLQILGQDIRLERRACRSQLESLERQEDGSNNGILNNIRRSGIWRNRSIIGRSKKITKQEEAEEAAAIAAAEKIKLTRKLEKEKELEEIKKRELDIESRREKLLETMIKEQVENELHEKLEEAERKRRKERELLEERQRKLKQDRQIMAPPSGTSKTTDSHPAKVGSDRHNMLINGRRSFDIRGSRKSLDGITPLSPKRKSLDMQDIGKAAQLAWSQSNSNDGRKVHSLPNRTQNLSPTRNQQQYLSANVPGKKKYEYVKPVVHRQVIRTPKRNVVNGKKSANISKETISVDTRMTTKSLNSSAKSSPDIRTSDLRSPELKSPILVSSSVSPPLTPTLNKQITDIEQTPLEAKMDKVMATLQGVDREACEQIMNEIIVMDEKILWDDIAGLKNAKSSLKETVVYPFLRPDLFKGLREPIRGMLLFGPPGTGKTMIAKAVATESHSTFFSISASSLLSKYLGESEKLVRALFYMAKRLAPSIIFIDEIDSLLTARSDNENESSRRIKTELLIQWSSLSSATAKESESDSEDEPDSRVLVLAATNLPWAIDEAARRRFSRRLYIPLPEYDTRLYHLRKLMSKQKNDLSDTDFEVIAKMTRGFSGSDITALAKEAAMEPIRDLGDTLMNADFNKIRGVIVKDFEKAMQIIKKSVSVESLQQYEDWAAGFGSTGA